MAEFSQFLTSLLEDIQESQNYYRAQDYIIEALGALHFFKTIIERSTYDQADQLYQQFKTLMKDEITKIEEKENEENNRETGNSETA